MKLQMPVSVSWTTTTKLYFAAAYLVNLFVITGFASFMQTETLLDRYYQVAVLLTYPAIFMLPLAALCWFSLRWQPVGSRPWIWVPVLLTGNILLSITLFGDVKLYDLYGFHINPFVINLLTTPGGIESLGSSSNTYATVGILLVSSALFHLLLFVSAIFVSQRQWTIPVTGRALFLVFLTLTLSERVIYGFADINNTASILNSSETIPLYSQVRFRSLARAMGIDVTHRQNIALKQGGQALNYPLRSLQSEAPGSSPNIIWLISESMRGDLLDADIMPYTFARSDKGWRLTHHYSGGNGTRQGLFSLFYGIFGTYWDAFLREQQGPVFIDLLQERGYDMNMYTSADFTYPEFDQTIFSTIPSDRLHQFNNDMDPVARDRANTDSIISKIQTATPDSPFMIFMFYESTHARYSFPPEDAIRTPFLDDLNYATMSRKSLAPKINELKNRYINAAHFIDGQMERIFQALDRQGLWQDTIVVVAGDHGEEFMENGFWGHNSGFSSQQISTPMVIWLPGKEPAVINQPTSHMDVTATILPLMGVTNPLSDYSQGMNLAEPLDRDYLVVSDWSGVSYISQEYKFTLPFNSSLSSSNKLFDAQDNPSNDLALFVANYRQELEDILASASQFLER